MVNHVSFSVIVIVHSCCVLINNFYSQLAFTSRLGVDSMAKINECVHSMTHGLESINN